VNVAETVNLVETTGATVRLDGEGVRVWYPDEEHRAGLADQVAFLRTHREEVTAFLRGRVVIPAMPRAVRLSKWELKQPPVAVQTCGVVTDTARFAQTTLEQLRIALAHPKRWVGWSVPQLIDRLAQVGVVAIVDGHHPPNRDCE
jgi:hypothetical protein